jgi:hypothetical protein
MRDWIAGAMTVLGTLLVLSGATIIILRAWGGLRPEPAGSATPATTEGPAESSFTADAGFPPPAAPTSPAPTSPAPTGAATTGRTALVERGAGALLRLGGPDRLIGWGILLLLLASITAGAIHFELGAGSTVR